MNIYWRYDADHGATFFLSVVDHGIFYIVIFVKIKWNKIFYKV